MTVSYECARDAKPKALALFSRAGPVNAVGVIQSNDGFALKIGFETEPDAGALPAAVDGVPVVVAVNGVIRAAGDR